MLGGFKLKFMGVTILMLALNVSIAGYGQLTATTAGAICLVASSGILLVYQGFLLDKEEE